MDSKFASTSYLDTLQRGAFPGNIDPWAEVGRYFHQIHGQMISNILNQIQRLLLNTGYVAAREICLQNNQFDAIYVYHMSSHQLVTIVELILPSTKNEVDTIAQYKNRRERSISHQEVNIVEVDLTRSIKRLLNYGITLFPFYHVALHLPDGFPRVFAHDFGERLKQIPLPLRRDVVIVALQDAYDDAYKATGIAAQILNTGYYTEDNLPFPSLLTDEQRQAALKAVSQWQMELKRLRDKDK